VSIELNLIK